MEVRLYHSIHNITTKIIHTLHTQTYFVILYRIMHSKPMTSTGTRVQLNRVRADLVLGGSAWNIHYRGADNQKHNHTTIILSTPLQFNKTLSFLAAPNIPIPTRPISFFSQIWSITNTLSSHKKLPISFLHCHCIEKKDTDANALNNIIDPKYILLARKINFLSQENTSRIKWDVT